MPCVKSSRLSGITEVASEAAATLAGVNVCGRSRVRPVRRMVGLFSSRSFESIAGIADGTDWDCVSSFSCGGVGGDTMGVVNVTIKLVRTFLNLFTISSTLRLRIKESFSLPSMGARQIGQTAVRRRLSLPIRIVPRMHSLQKVWKHPWTDTGDW